MGAANTTAARTIRHATPRAHASGPGTAGHDTAGHDTARQGTAGHDAAGHDSTGHDSTGHDSTGPGAIGPEDLELLGMLADGALLGAVARRLRTSERTVRRRIRNICDLLGVDAPIQAVVWAARRGLL
jgi:DNA-binding NarL/FixJ family response regulator